MEYPIAWYSSSIRTAFSRMNRLLSLRGSVVTQFEMGYQKIE